MTGVVVRWAVVALAVPLAAAAARKLADTVEQRQGTSTRLSRGLRYVGTKARLG